MGGFVSLVSGAQDKIGDYDFSKFNKSNYKGEWGIVSSPESKYEIWGYSGTDYNFTTNCNNSLFSNNSTMVFYWDCKDNNDSLSNYTDFSMNDPKHREEQCKETLTFICNNTWNKPDIYYICVGIFNNKKALSVSYWVPIKIVNNTTISVQNFFMNDEDNKSLDYYNSTLPNSTRNEDNSNSNNSSSNISNNCGNTCRQYCTYADKTQYFSAAINAIIDNSSKDQADADEHAIYETTTEVYWGDGFYDFNSYSNRSEISSNNNSNNNTQYSWNENFTHKWEETGEKNIYLRTYHWDRLSGDPVNSSSLNNTTILIIRDPKNFIFIEDSNKISSLFTLISFVTEPFSNLQNLGIFLVSAGLMILFFTYSKNKVPVKISILGIKPFYLKSVDTFIGIFTFIAGTYLYSVFGRCPWDIPFLEKLGLLPDIYFSMLYYEYATQQWNIPYFSILLGLIDVSFISTIIYRIGSPFLKGDLENIRLLRGKRPLIPLLNTLSFSLKRKK